MSSHKLKSAEVILLVKSEQLCAVLEPAVVAPSLRQHPVLRTDQRGSGGGSSLTPEESQISWGLFLKQFLKS